MTERLAQEARAILLDVAGGKVSVDEALLRLRDAMLPPAVPGSLPGLRRSGLYTTHEVARIFQVTPMTVIRWVDAGRLPAQRTAGGHRRIAAAAVVHACRAHNVPVPEQVLEAAAAAEAR